MLKTSSDHEDSNTGSLASRLRSALQAARCNLDIRERLVALVSDPIRFDPIVREFGAGHSIVRALREIALLDGQPPGRSAWDPAGS